MYAIRQAKHQDIDKLTHLLDSANLHTEGIAKHVSHFFVVEQIEAEKLVGSIGMEVYENYGLLRSFVIERPVGDLKLSLALLNTMLAYAASLSLRKVYLVTQQGSPFLSELGFTETSLSSLPEAIVNCTYFHRVHPQGKIMVYDCESNPSESAFST